MNSQGYVDVLVLKTFGRMKRYGIPVSVILEAARQSEKLHVKGNMVRRKVGWEKYAPQEDPFDDVTENDQAASVGGTSQGGPMGSDRQSNESSDKDSDNAIDETQRMTVKEVHIAPVVTSES